MGLHLEKKSIKRRTDDMSDDKEAVSHTVDMNTPEP